MNYFCDKAVGLPKKYNDIRTNKTNNDQNCFFGLSKEDWHDQALNVLGMAHKEPDNAKKTNLYETALLIICKFLT